MKYLKNFHTNFGLNEVGFGCLQKAQRCWKSLVIHGSARLAKMRIFLTLSQLIHDIVPQQVVQVQSQLITINMIYIYIY